VSSQKADSNKEGDINTS